MKNLLKLEELAMLALCVFSLTLLNVSWWVYVLVAVGPDVSMIGYAGGKKAGAFFYNLFHHKGIAIIVFIIGVIIGDQKGELFNIAGLILFGHSSLDRMLGYGLKLKEGFTYTHLGIIGKKGNSI
jgi:hypothetical protein